ncbi:hypothetical protein [Microbacterium sp. LWS13-1.2]|uniref:Uncharacterized protein n=1 Tax=Microbacterium sp. LWS13-1.2 TaxID=3135264 RepID=A0AAU6SDB7_9MICO
MSDEAGETDIFADHEVVKRLGRWTIARDFAIRAPHSTVVMDLRSPEIPDGVVTARVDLHRATLELLVADDTQIDQTRIIWMGRGRVTDAAGQRRGRRIVLAGSSADSEVRVKRGGVAILAAMVTREFIEDAKTAHRAGGSTTVDDPTRDPNATWRQPE